MAYKVIIGFNDLKDNGYRYKEGDSYPRAGVEPGQERINELLGKENKRGMPLIIEHAAGQEEEHAAGQKKRAGKKIEKKEQE